MTHEELSEMYELYALGVLTADEKNEIDEHLERGCAECSTGVRHALELNAIIATLPDQVNPPKRLRKRVLASIGADTSPSRWMNVWAAAAAALAIALVIVGLKANSDLDNARRDLNASVSQRDEARRQLEASRGQLSTVQAALQFLNEPETVQATFGGTQALPPRGHVFVNPNRGVLLIASNLPPVPSGRTYEMWVVPKNGNPVPAGLFQPDNQGNVIHLLAGPVNRADTAAIAVSVEPETGSQAPTTKPLIVAAI